MNHQTVIPTKISIKEYVKLLIAILFIIGIFLYTVTTNTVDGTRGTLLIISAMIGGYMALNIGANDVANNVGPAVGSMALTMTGAIVIAAIFEAGGALIAGGDVVSTIKKGIIDPSGIDNSDTFIWLMMAALLSGAIWLNIATAIGAPVSTTHSIVGGVLGAGIAAGGFGIADWHKMSAIAASWVISPMLGGIIAAGFLYLIKNTIMYKSDKLAAAKKWLPIFVAVMAWAFSTYLILKGIKKIWTVDFVTAATIGFAFSVATYFIVKPFINKAANKLENHKDSVDHLFTVPLIFSAALLSFAHGANDVANAIAPLAAINEAVHSGGVAQKAAIPLWIMMIGAIGIATGLALFGPKLIRTVGSEITELNRTRAYCIAMAASITVIIASQFGLPVSSTHIAVGGVFGVGFLREYIKANYDRITEEIRYHHEASNPQDIENFLNVFQCASTEEKRQMLKKIKANSKKGPLTKKERKKLNKMNKEELVKRSHLLKIIMAWLITVPISAIMAAILFFTLRGILLH